MKITCTQENLARALAIVGHSVATRATLPVLSNILITAKNGRIKLTSTDLEIGVSTWVGGQVENEGALTVPARLLVDFVTNNKDPKIDLVAKETTLNLKSDHFEANIKGIDALEFPAIPEVKDQNLIQIKAKDFVEAAKQTLIAPATDDTRPVLAGVLFSFKDSSLKMVATDSYRLAEKKLLLEKKVEPAEVIIPAGSLNEVLRIIGSAPLSDIAVSINENQVLFVVGDTQIVSRLIEGSFPAYEQIIPQAPKTAITVDTEEMIGVVRMAALFAKESANNIKLEFQKGRLLAKSVSAQIGDNISTMPAEVSGPELEIAFNAKYLLDFLSAVGEKNVRIGITDRFSAGILKPGKATDYIYIIMPLRVEE